MIFKSLLDVMIFDFISNQMEFGHATSTTFIPAWLKTCRNLIFKRFFQRSEKKLSLNMFQELYLAENIIQLMISEMSLQSSIDSYTKNNNIHWVSLNMS